MENEGSDQHGEDFAQLLKRLKDEYSVNETEVAKRIGVSVSAVNTWSHRKRTPRPDVLRRIAQAFPKFTLEELFAATERLGPGPLSPDAEARILDLIRSLPREQQEIAEVQLRAMRDLNEGRTKAN
ncbi:helix-turn-helix transcriptional regulator [Streptomyces silaceus]|uniref:helix-turn-helix transcriptional regulator n=1 Tax=Streptomyces silaceus TaxID=545123 RepID=UPI0006EBD0F1|nr:helix-turn-helix transcriptional regulator [Streptomyces silaceus]